MSHDTVAPHILIAQRKATENLIKVFGKPVQIIRRGLQSDGAGGVKKQNETTLAAVRRYFAPVTEDNQPVVTQVGDVSYQRYVLIGLHDDDIRDEDHFLVDGVRREIAWVDQNRDYQVKAFVNVLVN